MENSIERIQKITEALYRVTELFSDKEPLKWQLRLSAIELLDVFTETEKESFLANNRTAELVERISRLLKLAYETNSFISNINFEILRREYLSLGDFIKFQLEDKKIVFSLEFSDNDEDKRHNSDNGHKGQDNIDNGHNGQEEKSIEQSLETIKQPIILKERKRKILSLLDKSEWLSIRDICNSLPELGAKSIQRDLLEMVEDGILKKEGDKRWRKYCMAG